MTSLKSHYPASIIIQSLQKPNLTIKFNYGNPERLCVDAESLKTASTSDIRFCLFKMRDQSIDAAYGAASHMLRKLAAYQLFGLCA